MNQTVFCAKSPQIIVEPEGDEIIGACFTPQDGNALLSSAATILWYLDPDTYRARMRSLFYKRPYIFTEV